MKSIIVPFKYRELTDGNKFIDDYIGSDIELAKHCIKCKVYSSILRIEYMIELYPKILNLKNWEIGLLIGHRRETISRARRKLGI